VWPSRCPAYPSAFFSRNRRISSRSSRFSSSNAIISSRASARASCGVCIRSRLGSLVAGSIARGVGYPQAYVPGTFTAIGNRVRWLEMWITGAIWRVLTKVTGSGILRGRISAGTWDLYRYVQTD